MALTWQTTKVGDSDMRLYVSSPGTGVRAPAVIVIPGQTGVDDFLQFSDMVARQGYVAVAPDLYHRDPADCRDEPPTRRSRLRDSSVIQDINAAIGFIKSQQSVAAGRIGIVGFCMGGRIVYLMSAVNPDIKAGVMYYGSDPFSAWGDGPAPFARTKDIHCPIMGHFGEDDMNPSPADMRKLDAELTRHGKIHEFHSYTGAEHAFANIGSAKYREHAAKASWPRTFDFFARHLGKPEL
ncbi:MAG TPA: dienelactone hydrolase family protein [Candidatus Limnocylindria bacterium]|nr:dienelactone hydrolase family protein [Candidatus Limnocylindria bacterium]